MDKTTFFQDYQNLIDSFEALSKSADNPFFKSKYVPLKVILPLVKENCKKHNFLFFQVPVFQEGKNLLNTIIEHKEGRKIEGKIEIVAKDAGDPQKLGAGLTYMRRYMLTCMLGLEEDDDDGNKASGKTVEVKNKAPRAIPAGGTRPDQPTCKVCGQIALPSKFGNGYYCANYKTCGKDTIVMPDKRDEVSKKIGAELDAIEEINIDLVK
jgi:hypothetical protein